jgi:hypothetical protein
MCRNQHGIYFLIDVSAQKAAFPGLLTTPPSKLNACKAPLLANWTGFATLPILELATGNNDSNRPRLFT